MKQLRVVMALVGFIAAAASVALDDHRLGWVAISLLGVSLLGRLIQQRRATRTKDEASL
jgi:hypothetical protein